MKFAVQALDEPSVLIDDSIMDYSSDSSELEATVDQTFCERFKSLFKNGPFILFCISLTFLYFVITGIQFWVSDYLITDLKVNENTVFITFAIVSITGPVLGVIVGGNVTTALGGYNSKKALRLSLIVSSFCACVAAPIAFINSFPLFVALLWFLLFFGGSVLPCMTGIMLNTVKRT